jgi:hypothetical protein
MIRYTTTASPLATGGSASRVTDGKGAVSGDEEATADDEATGASDVVVSAKTVGAGRLRSSRLTPPINTTAAAAEAATAHPGMPRRDPMIRSARLIGAAGV